LRVCHLHWSLLSCLKGRERGEPMLLRWNSALLKGLALTLRPDVWLPVDLIGLSSAALYCRCELESEFLSAFLVRKAYWLPPEGCSPSFFLLKNLGLDPWKVMDCLS